MPQVYLNWKRKCTLGFAIDKGLFQKERRLSENSLHTTVISPFLHKTVIYEILDLVFGTKNSNS